MKKIIALILVSALCLCALMSCDNSTDESSGKIKVGICQLVEHEALDAATKGFKDALVEEFGDKVEFIESNAGGDSATCTTIMNDLVSKKVDLILANATASLQAAQNTTTTIPVLGTSITDYGTALGIDNFNGVVGGNISGASDLAPLDEQAQMILDIFPETKTVGLLYCSAEPNSAYQVKVVREYLEAKGVEVKDFPFSDSNDVVSVSQAAAAACDVLYLPTDNTAASCIETINGAIGDTPAITGESGMCTGCGVATLSFSYYDLGVTTGKMAIEILKNGADISTMKIKSPEKFEKLYNADKCAELGIDTAKLTELGFKPIEK